MKSKPCSLVLASASPRRKELLQSVGLDCEVIAADIDEQRIGRETVETYVERLAVDKAQTVYEKLNAELIAILSADTVVVQDQDIYGKPSNKDDAFRMWKSLSGRSHNVLTAVCLQTSAGCTVQTVSTEVCFEVLSEDQMHAYWSSGEPKDKAGAYAIQGFASAWVKFIHGSYSNVVGLPLFEVNNMLKPIDLNWL